MKNLKIDADGNIISGISFILIISCIILFIVLLNMIYLLNNENIDSIANDNFKYVLDDYIQNIEFLTYDSVKELSNKIISSKIPSKNSQNDIKKILNKKLDEKNKEYYEKYNIKIESEAISIENSENPRYIIAKIKIDAFKDDEKFNRIVESRISVSGLNDPLPILMCGYHPSFTYNKTNILYKDSLADFLKKNNIKEHIGYKNAISPFIIKFCPYDPYTHHGDNFTLNDCLRNGYYHESSDGSCYLCRLEGKGICPHYGFETFIIAFSNESQSVSALDHVVFHDMYLGDKYYYYANKSLFLDSSHKLKYGLV